MGGKENRWQYAEVKSLDKAHLGTNDPEKGWIDSEAAGVTTSSPWTDTYYGDKETEKAEAEYMYTSGPPNMRTELEEESPQEGLFKVLLYLSLLNPLTTLLFSLYAILITPLIFLFGPLARLLCGAPPLPGQVIRTLLPLTEFQLDLIRPSALSSAKETPIPSNAARLFAIAVFSPFIAIGIAIAAGVAAFFWLYATILGEPNQNHRQGKEREGKSAARWVRGMWEKWLLLGLR